MSESLRDRVARVLGEHETFGQVGFRDEPLTHRCHCSCGWSTEPVAFDGDTVDTSPAHGHVADALIAAGLVTEPQVSRNAHERLAQQHGMSLALHWFAEELRIHDWTSSGHDVTVEYRPEAPREAL